MGAFFGAGIGTVNLTTADEDSIRRLLQGMEEFDIGNN
jgi:hypothetical protein